MRISKFFDTETDRNMVTVKSPNIDQISNLTYLHACIIDKVREKFGAIVETSGLRPAKPKYSQHEDGMAADIVPSKANIHEVFEWIRDNLVFDQIILETNQQGAKWIHVSLTKGGNRKQSLLGLWSNDTNSMKYINA